MSTPASRIATASPRIALGGIGLAAIGAVAASGKAIIVKLGLRHGVDATTLLALRMLMALPLFVLMALWARAGPSRCPGLIAPACCGWASPAITCPACSTSRACSTSA